MYLLVLATGALLSSAGLCADGPTFDQVHFKATHNSYALPDPPKVQIDTYDVWEIELDFGIPFDSPDFVVGHNGPQPKHRLSSLGDWVRNTLAAESLSVHPLIIKLEAKTTEPCGPLRFPSFQCEKGWDDAWQTRLRDSLRAWIGDTNWITPRRFHTDMQSKWPSVSNLAGKVIVTLQDSDNDRDIDRESEWFFGRDIPGLMAAWPPIENEAGFKSALQSSENRLTMDDGYRRTWSARRSPASPEISR